MQDVAPGRTIGGRYTLNERRLASADGVEAWSATDAAAHVEVTLTLFPATAATSPAILDAARRAAHVQDPRLVRIVDMGTSGHLSWIVEEHHPGAGTLVDLVEDNPLSGDETRTVVGEAASCLAAAADQGMHHLRLTPYSILITRTGEVKLSGLGTVRALDGGEEPPLDRAERLDTLGLLAIGYYALTTRWPLPTEVPGILPAPRVVGGVPAPSEIAAGVPDDLDGLCRLALNGQKAPACPRELTEALAPWRPTLREPAFERQEVPPAHLSPWPDAADLPVLPAVPVPAPASNDGQPPTEALPDRTPYAEQPPTEALPDSTPYAVAAAPPGTAEATAEIAGTDPPAPHDEAETRSADAASKGSALAGAASAAAGATAAAATTAGDVVGRLGTMARAAAGNAHRVTEEMRARVAAERAERERLDANAVRLADIPDETDLEAPGPLMRMLDPGERPGTHSRLVLSSVAGFVAFALLVSTFVIVRGIGRTTDEVANASTSPATMASTPAGTSASSTTPPAGAMNPVPIVEGTSIDPVGNDGENDRQIPRTYDGSAETAWQSELYRADPRWNGTPSRGVGLAFRLEKPTTLRTVKLTFPAQPGQSGTISVGPRPELEGATKVGEFTDATGSLDVPLSGAPEAAYVVVWFTKAPRDGGGYRASLAEIAPMG